jgi:hypothetical protein
VRRTAASKSRGVTDGRVCSPAKTVLVFGDFEILFGFRSPIYRAPGWQVFYRYIVVPMLGSDGRGRGRFLPYLGLLNVLSQLMFWFVRARKVNS